MENKVEPAENNGKCDNGDDAVYDDNSAYYFEIVIYKTIIITAISLYHMNPIFFFVFLEHTITKSNNGPMAEAMVNIRAS